MSRHLEMNGQMTHKFANTKDTPKLILASPEQITRCNPCASQLSKPCSRYDWQKAMDCFEREADLILLIFRETKCRLYLNRRP